MYGNLADMTMVLYNKGIGGSFTPPTHLLHTNYITNKKSVWNKRTLKEELFICTKRDKNLVISPIIHTLQMPNVVKTTV